MPKYGCHCPGQWLLRITADGSLLSFDTNGQILLGLELSDEDIAVLDLGSNVRLRRADRETEKQRARHRSKVMEESREGSPLPRERRGLWMQEVSPCFTVRGLMWPLQWM